MDRYIVCPAEFQLWPNSGPPNSIATVHICDTKKQKCGITQQCGEVWGMNPKPEG